MSMVKTPEQILAEHPWLAPVRDAISEECHDCRVRLGEAHQWGCDAVTCSVCGEQWIACGHEDAEPEVFIGVLHPGLVRVAIARGLWCRCLLVLEGVETPLEDAAEFQAAFTLEREKRGTIRWHVPCESHDVGAVPDLNRASLCHRTGS